jgi:hypothetical protein
MKILQNVFILYVVFLISLLNIGWFIYYNNYNSLIAFITCCLTVYLMSHNMIVVLGVSMIVVNTLSMFNLVKIINKDGFKEGNTIGKGVRYIEIVNSTQTNPTYIQIGAIKAFDNRDVDVAFRKTVTSSGNWPGYEAHKAVDGNVDSNGKINSDIYSSFHSAPTIRNTDFWKVDLEQEYMLTRIVYFNRNECCRERIIGQTMILYNSANQIVKKFQFESNKLEHTFVVYTDKEIATAVAEAAAAAEVIKLQTIKDAKSYNQTPIVSTPTTNVSGFKNKSDSDSDDSDDDSDDENSNYMQDKTIINKLKKMDPVIMDVLMNMKNGHIDIINKTLNSIIDENVLDV